MKRTFSNKIALVTGAAGGIGKEIVKRLLELGAFVIAVDLDKNGLKNLSDELTNERLVIYDVDITNYDKLEEMYLFVKEKFGGIDFLFNNAGAVHRSLFVKTELSVFKKVLEVNLWGSVYLTKLFINDIIERKGAIEVTSSVAGFAPLYGRTFYSGSKFALHGVFETLRTELINTGVTVTIVSPGFTKTPFEQAALDADGKKLTKKRKNVGKYLSPEYVADKIINAVGNNKRFVVISTVGKLSLVLRKCLPVLYDRLMYRSVMEEFIDD